MYLGIEIGGTKLQLGVGAGDGRLVELVRRDVEAERGADRIRAEIDSAARELAARHRLTGIGYGFGGPVSAESGRVIKSHQVAGWDDFPLVAWTRERLDAPVALGNDCDVAALAEARYGAGKGRKTVFFVTIGTGIGGGLVINAAIHRGAGPAAAEIGHLRPGPDAVDAESTVESIAAGPGIVATVRRRLATVSPTTKYDVADLVERCHGRLEQLTAKQVADAALEGNSIASAAFDSATRALGWAIAQVVTLLSPDVVVLGGGVSLSLPRIFLDPVREQTARYVFPPLAGTYEIVPAALGEEVVVHGALALAAHTLE
jgi:glucokinase